MSTVSSPSASILPSQLRHLRNLPWQGQWAEPKGDPANIVRLVAYDEDNDCDVSFYSPRE